MDDLVVAITGASGAAYAVRLLQNLSAAGHRVHLTCSPAALEVFRQELRLDFTPHQIDVEALLHTNLFPDADHGHSPVWPPENVTTLGSITSHHFQDFSAGIASGSFRTAGMVICPCSMGTLASLANGISSNLIHRAAGVHLKERRKLIVVPRETPLGSIQLDNMQKLSHAGALILPAMPGWYHEPRSMLDLVDFVVARILDQLNLPIELMNRWGGPPVEDGSSGSS